MIYISIGLSNPWSTSFNNIWNQSGRLTRNKSWELELVKGRQIIGFEIGYTMRQSHAGFTLELALLSYSLSFQIYDNRHWNYIDNNWEIYADNQTNN